MKILLLASGFNGMVQRVHRELVLDRHDVEVEFSGNEERLLKTIFRLQPRLIICPFLKQRIPESVWSQVPCLIVHPGIVGDRGPSSLDWAIDDQEPTWGVTLIQANGEMDGGDIWGSREFPMREATKASIYRRDVIPAAVALIKDAIRNHDKSDFRPRKLDYASQDVRGRERPQMAAGNRAIDWAVDTCDVIARKINAADSFPGVLDQIGDTRVRLYGAVAERDIDHGHSPGDLIGHADGAICRAAVDGRIWIRQLKPADRESPMAFKVPAALFWHRRQTDSNQRDALEEITDGGYSEITVSDETPVAYVEFDFYNGAMNTDQCRRLLACLEELRARDDIRVIVLMGGRDFWSNGIHLGCIQAADDPAAESWDNINAINDVIRLLIETDDKLTVAALRNNAGAGGAIMPLACDDVFVRQGVVLNPHYRKMGLYGSEYWGYLLPRRVGPKMAERLTEECMPVLASEALALGMADEIAPEDWENYHQQLRTYCESLAGDPQFRMRLARKKEARLRDEGIRPLADYRRDELKIMKATFDDPDSAYHDLRYRFVHKLPAATDEEPIPRALRTTAEKSGQDEQAVGGQKRGYA